MTNASSSSESAHLATFRKGAEEAAAAERAIQREIDKKKKPNGETKNGGAMQAGARTYPEPPLPGQHLRKPGNEAALDLKPMYDAPHYKGSENLIAGYVSAIALGTVAAARRGRLRLAAHALMMPVYWLGISFAAYRALLQLVFAPHYWEKTEHVGIRLAPPPTSVPKSANSGEEAQSVARDALAH